MANIPVKIKSLSIAGAVPSGLAAGELAVNTADKQIFFADQSNVTRAIPTASGMEVGDIVTSARELSAPEFLPANGGVYLKSTYPELFGEMSENQSNPSNLSKWDTVRGELSTSIVPSNNVYSVAFSPDGNYLAIGGEFGSPSSRLAIYKRNGDTFAKLADPTGGMPSSPVRSVAFSPDGNYLAIGGEFAYPTYHLAIYKRNGDTFAFTGSITGTATNHYVYSVAFSPDGNYLAIGGIFNSPSSFLAIYKRNGDTFTFTGNINGISQGSGYESLSFSPDGQYLAVPGTGSSYIKIFKTGLNLNPNIEFKLPDYTSMVKSGMKAYIKAK